MCALKPRYTTRFLASATVYTPSASERQEAHASIDRLRDLLPEGIDPETHPTVLYLAGNLAVAGVTNLNDDALTLEDALGCYRAFEQQQVNIEHSRATVVGFIVKAGLSEFGTDRLISEDEARAAGQPVNIAIALAVWRVVDPELCAFLQQADAPASPDKGRLSLSFEVGFNDYDIVVLPKGASNLALASKVITADAPEFARFDKLLRVNGGRGAQGDSRVARVIKGDIVPLGAGIVAVPAAAVKGLVTITEARAVSDETEAGMYAFSSTQCTLAAEDAAPFLAYAASIPDEHIYTDPDDPTVGREGEPHITALYGIKGTDHAPIQGCLANHGPITARLGEVTAFVNDDKPYDVLKVDVESEDLHRVHHLIKTSTEVESKWPDYRPHLTIAYLRKGMARGYVGDTRFKGRGLTFPSIDFSPHTGDRIQIPLKMLDGSTAPTDQFGQVGHDAKIPIPAETLSSEVYSDEDMATPSRLIKLSAGWQERLAAMQAAAGGDPLVNGVTITLSDGRTMSNVKVFDGATLELDKELSMSGVIITDMTPGVGPQADDQVVEHPAKADVYPTTAPAQQARQAATNEQMREGQRAAYTDASAKITASMQRIADLLAEGCHSDLINPSLASVSPSTIPTSPMNLTDLKQSLASVKTIEELPAVVANVALFAEAITKASESLAKERDDAKNVVQTTQATLEEVKAQLVTLRKTHDDIVAAQTLASAQAAYQERMTVVAATFDLDDEVRAEIVDEVKACADDASFAKWLASAKKKMKGFMKKAKTDCAEPDGDETKAKLAAQTALASAANDIVDTPINNTMEVNDKSLRDRYAETFAEGISVNGVKVRDIKAKK